MNRKQKSDRDSENKRITMDMTREDRMAAMKAEFEKRKAAIKLAERQAVIKERKAKGLAHYLKKMGKS